MKLIAEETDHTLSIQEIELILQRLVLCEKPTPQQRKGQSLLNHGGEGRDFLLLLLQLLVLVHEALRKAVELLDL